MILTNCPVIVEWSGVDNNVHNGLFLVTFALHLKAGTMQRWSVQVPANPQVRDSLKLSTRGIQAWMGLVCGMYKQRKAPTFTSFAMCGPALGVTSRVNQGIQAVPLAARRTETHLEVTWWGRSAREHPVGVNTRTTFDSRGVSGAVHEGLVGLKPSAAYEGACRLLIAGLLARGRLHPVEELAPRVMEDIDAEDLF